MPVLIQQQNETIINKYEISISGLNIGRSINNDVFLDDPSVSKQHAKIEVKELKDGSCIYILIDLNSTNTTHVNQQKINEHLLSDQDQVQIGLSSFKYIDENEDSLAATKQFKKSWLPGVSILK